MSDLTESCLCALLTTDDLLSEEAVLSQRLSQCTTIQLKHLFHAGTAQHQQDIIQHKLWSLRRRLFATDYRRLGHFICTHLLPAVVAADISSERLQLPCPAQCCKTDRVDNIDTWQKIEERGRLALYSAVEELEANVSSIVAGRLMSLQRQAILQYQCLLASMVSDPTYASATFNDWLVSRSLDQLLDDLQTCDEVSSTSDDDRRCTDADRAAIGALEKELSDGWFAGSTVLSVDGKEIRVPNIPSSSYQKILLLEACLKPTIAQLFPDDIEPYLKNDCAICTQDEILSCGASADHSLSASDVLLVEAAGHVYRLIHGIELCCGLDSPSCVLSTLLVISMMDRMKRTDHLSFAGADDTDVTAAAGTSSSGTQTTLLFQSWSDEEVLKGRVTVDAETCAAHEAIKLDSCQNDDGIFGVDTWLTSPIESSLCPTDAGHQTESASVELNGENYSENWLLQPDDFCYMNVINSELAMTM
jgi:hypothetical protein